MHEISLKQKKKISILVFLATALGNAGSTLYLPAMLQIGQELHTTHTTIKLTLSVYLIGIGLSQIFYGPLSDAFGRRVNLLFGLAIFTLATWLIVFTDSIHWLLVGRFIQGLGIGAANAVGFATLKDMYTERSLITQLSYLSLCVGATPILAPLLGGYFVTYMGWKFCFIFLGAAGLFIWIFKYFLIKETNFYLDKKAHYPNEIARNFSRLLGDKSFIGFLLIVSMGFSSVLALNTILPFIFIDVLGIKPDWYGWLFSCVGCGYILGAYSSGKVSAYFSPLSVLRFGILLQIISGLIGMVLGWFSFTVVAILVPLTSLMIGVGVLIPLGTSGAMKCFPKIAGSSAALLGCAMFIISGVCISIIAHIGMHVPIMLFFILALLGFISFLSLCLVNKKNNSIG